MKEKIMHFFIGYTCGELIDLLRCYRQAKEIESSPSQQKQLEDSIRDIESHLVECGHVKAK